MAPNKEMLRSLLSDSKAAQTLLDDMVSGNQALDIETIQYLVKKGFQPSDESYSKASDTMKNFLSSMSPKEDEVQVIDRTKTKVPETKVITKPDTKDAELNGLTGKDAELNRLTGKSPPSIARCTPKFSSTPGTADLSAITTDSSDVVLGFLHEHFDDDEWLINHCLDCHNFVQRDDVGPKDFVNTDMEPPTVTCGVGECTYALMRVNTKLIEALHLMGNRVKLLEQKLEQMQPTEGSLVLTNKRARFEEGTPLRGSIKDMMGKKNQTTK